MSCRRRIAKVVLVAATVLSAFKADAGGLTLPVHGVRGLGRAGAMVAGGDDASGIWFNPANIGFLNDISIVLDANLIKLDLDYRRVDSGGNQLPSVSNSGAPLPIPTLAIAARVWRGLRIGFSVSAPMATAPEYPRPNYNVCNPQAPVGCVDTVHQDAPQRYSLITESGTFFIRFDLSLAYQIFEQLSVGVSLQNSIVRFALLKAVSSYNGVLSGGPEDPDFDSLTRVVGLQAFMPSAQIGLNYRPFESLSIGLAYQLPSKLSTDADLEVQLPVSPLYDASSISGADARMSVTMPMSLSFGVQWKPTAATAIELDVVWENWSAFDAIRFEPKDIRIDNLPGVGTYFVPSLEERFGFSDTVSVRLGAEHTFRSLPLTLRGGYGFEQGASAGDNLSITAYDPNKHLFSLGLSYTISRFRLDAAYGLIFAPTRTVDFRASTAQQINPIDPDQSVTVGGGRYRGMYHIIGLGIAAQL